MLRDVDSQGTRVGVLVVWEPVLKTDVSPPQLEVDAFSRGAGVLQFWDPKLLLSEEIIRASKRLGAEAEGLPAISNRATGPVVWDVVALYESSLSWDQEFPRAVFAGFPIVGAVSQMRERILKL